MENSQDVKKVNSVLKRNIYIVNSPNLVDYHNWIKAYGYDDRATDIPKNISSRKINPESIPGTNDYIK